VRGESAHWQNYLQEFYLIKGCQNVFCCFPVTNTTRNFGHISCTDYEYVWNKDVNRCANAYTVEKNSEDHPRKDARHTVMSWLLLLIGLKNQLAKIHNSSLDTSHSARNLGFIFDEHLAFSDQITAVSKARYYHIRQLRCIRPYLDSSTACTIATSIVHSILDYCNALYYKLPKSQLSRLQQIQNSLAPTVVKAPKSCHITPILRSLHWLRITERIEYKLLSLTYKVLTSTQPTYLHNLNYIQRHRSTRSSSVVTLTRPPSSSSLKITDRSFRYASPCLWNQLPFSLRQPHSGTSSWISYSRIPSPITFSSSDSPLCTFITPCLFLSRLKTYLFHKSYTPRSFTSSSRTASTDLCMDSFFWVTRFLILLFPYFFDHFWAVR